MNKENTMYWIYIIRNIVSNNVYVGQTSRGPKARFSQHRSDLRKNKHKNSHLQNAWNKYGEKYFIMYPLYSCTDSKEINNLEEYLIGWCKTLGIAYNTDNGGLVGSRGLVRSPEAIEKMRRASTGRPNPNKGKTGIYSEETLEKIRAARAQQVFTEETKEKIGQHTKRMWENPEHKEKTSKAISESRKGMKFTEEHCKNITLGKTNPSEETMIKFCKGRGYKEYTCWGETKYPFQWAKDPRCVVSNRLLTDRLRWGWEIEEALTKEGRKTKNDESN